MFNRNNLTSNPFAGREASPRPPRDPYSQAPQQPPRPGHSAGMSGGGYGSNRGGDYDTNMDDYEPPRSQRMPSRPLAGGAGRPGQRASGQRWQLSIEKGPTKLIYMNVVAVSPSDFPPSRDGSDLLLLLQGQYVVSARPTDQFPPGCISLSEPQRTWMGIALADLVDAQIYDPFSQGNQAYLGSMDMEIGFASKTKKTEVPYDQDDLAKAITQAWQNQVLQPGQRMIFDLKSIPLMFVVKTVQLMDLSEKPSSTPTSSDPRSRGILTTHTRINFFKDPKAPFPLKPSNRRPAADSIIAPDFKFENMGIGGLDSEFSTIFRRAFASRIFPPGLVEKLGIQHVKGILLFGPPGTGKTLIARQIGKMLNTREPKVINGPEVLNKYVGQSEENIRKLFADAEKEYKEKGDESGLHIIIFDELDAVCKQRGSTGGGTGVGDSVVNQLLSKLDGVDQLNNILLIGMTNRMDMIDDALLRPGRLEVHMEISLPDEHGRAQILKIHTQKMRNNNVMANDVDLAELAHETKNFSGAEIGGLVKSATSFAFNRHVKVGTMAGVSDDVVNMKVNRADFQNALEEVKPAFGVSEEELSNCLHGGIIHYSPYIADILGEGRLYVDQVRKPDSTPIFSVLLHGPAGSGKTALAAKIAMDSEYPFIKLISPEDMIGMNESAKVAHMTKVFMDAYKSPMSVVVMDSIERIIEWVPIGPRFSNPILQTLVTLLRKQPPKGRRLLILATTTERSILQQLDIFNNFNSDLSVPELQTYDELAFVMKDSKAFSDDDVRKAVGEIKDITRSEKCQVGIKKVLLGIETAKQDRDMATRFGGVIARTIAERSVYQ
jgi:vesicle-fusing ATPase